MRTLIGLSFTALLLAACGSNEKGAGTGGADTGDAGTTNVVTAQDTTTAPADTSVAQAQDAQRQPIPEPSAAGGMGAAGGTSASFASLVGDAAKGEKIFGQCRACHSIAAGQNRVGPTLYGVVDRRAGTVPGYNYSKANKESGAIWTEDTLYRYLEDPRAFIPGTKMTFPGLKQAQDRADVIAYLRKAGPGSGGQVAP